MAEITKLELNKKVLSLEVGSEETLTVTKTPVEGEGQVEWASSHENVATVENGVISALEVGTTTITVSAGSVNDTCEVTVTPKESEKVGLDLSYPNIGINLLYIIAK